MLVELGRVEVLRWRGEHMEVIVQEETGTALHRSMRLDERFEIAQCLVEHIGMDVNARDSDRVKPLRYLANDRKLNG